MKLSAYSFLVIILINGKQEKCYNLKKRCNYAHYAVLCMHFNILGLIWCHRALKLVAKTITIILLLTQVLCLHRL